MFDGLEPAWRSDCEPQAVVAACVITVRGLMRAMMPGQL
jgi:hypothetical protein